MIPSKTFYITIAQFLKIEIPKFRFSKVALRVVTICRPLSLGQAYLQASAMSAKLKSKGKSSGDPSYSVV